MPRMRDGRAAAVADRDLDRGTGHCPRHLQPFAWQRVSVQNRIAEQFADDEYGVPYGAIEHPGSPEVIGQRPARESDARRRTRQVDDARSSHLPGHPPSHRGAALSALRMFKCPAQYGRKPAVHEALLTIGGPVTCLRRPEITLCQASKALRPTDPALNGCLRYPIVTIW